ncbi:hypothetical protein F2P81_020416 [Scophthalmus maximus]|uniref:AAA+ ATPase domain-containing protein n=1 Tax=Scophthalmus maximus TaxID=52904 RepID=A0A6A4S5X6_SCOMX|nr:hypothetical protein F2P81_020416 [Scophthalmus maximus]
MKNRGGGGSVDSRLRQRVEQYLESSNSEYVDLSALALELQKLHRRVRQKKTMEYGRRNKIAFRIQVEKVYDAVMKESRINYLESKHLAKRAKHSHDDNGEGSSSSENSAESSDAELIQENTPSNHLNSSLTSLYRKGNSDSAAGSPRRDPLAASGHVSADTPPPSAGTQVSTGGWFIDRGRGPEKSNILIDLCDEEPRNTATNVRTCGEQTDVSLLEPEKKSHRKSKKRTKRTTETTEPLTLTKKAKSKSIELQYPTLKFEDSSSPCILFIDEIDAITPKREVASKDMERRIVAQLLTCMDDLNSLTVTAQVLVIGATNRPDSLDPALRRAGRFDREICLGIPDEAARLRILKTLCRKLTLPDDFDYQRLAHLTPGYVGADLMALCREAAMSAVNRALMEMRGWSLSQSQSATAELSPSGVQAEAAAAAAVTDGDVGEQQTTDVRPQGELWHLLNLLKSIDSLSEEQLAGLSILMSDFQTSLSSIQPSAKREGFATVPDVTWENVGALQDIREELTMAILAPVRSPEQFKALGLSAPSGVLLAGPPGCGKTLLAKAVANESGLNFISVKGPELLNMYVGESERAVRQVFQRGRNSAPCVIFFDEIDALCPRRSGHESGSSVRVVNQLLTEMDGLETRRQVFIMAATNRPDIIDPAILRPGRLDKTLGADLTALVREASVNALRAYLKSQSPPAAAASGHTCSGDAVADIRVGKQNFEDAFKKVRPSVSKKDQKTYEQLRQSLST